MGQDVTYSNNVWQVIRSVGRQTGTKATQNPGRIAPTLGVRLVVAAHCGKFRKPHFALPGRLDRVLFFVLWTRRDRCIATLLIA